jgi:hypothetical protein
MKISKIYENVNLVNTKLMKLFYAEDYVQSRPEISKWIEKCFTSSSTLFLCWERTDCIWNGARNRSRQSICTKLKLSTFAYIPYRSILLIDLRISRYQIQRSVPSPWAAKPEEWQQLFLGTFSRLPKATISFITSVCPSVRMKQLGSYQKHLREMWYFIIFRNLSRKFKSYENMGRIRGNFKLWHLRCVLQ